MGEIESELAWRDKGSLLVNMVTENFSKRKVENMRRGVVISQWSTSILSKDGH
jgi:hypothetical protein